MRNAFLPRTLLAACALAATAPASAPALAQDAVHEPSAVRAGRYAVEPGHTQVGFTLLHMGFSYYSGAFSGASGTLELDPARPADTRLSVTIPVGSVATTSAKLDGELKGPDWFDAARYPTATFQSTRVTPTGPGAAEVSGTLTLHGVSVPEVLAVRFVGAGINPLSRAYTVGFQATCTISRSAFGVRTYVPLVGDQVSLTIAGAFERQN